MRLFYSSIFSLAFILLLFGCDKIYDGPQCETPTQPKVSSNSPVLKGEPLVLYVTNFEDDVKYYWQGPGGYTAIGNKIEFEYADKYLEGTFSVIGLKGNCVTDSTLTDVKIEYATAPCTPPKNTLEFDGASDVTYSFVACTPSQGNFAVRASSAALIDIDLTFYKEPGLGTYRILTPPSSPFPEFSDEVSIRLNYRGSIMSPVTDGLVYVTAPNGKLQITFCNVTFRFSTVNITASGSLTCN